MNKTGKFGLGKARVVVNTVLGLISYFVLMALLFVPLMAWF